MSAPVFYINLAHRVDRRAQVEAELRRLDWTGSRVDAVHTPERGAVGCALSHAAALRAKIPAGFWSDLKDQGLMVPDAPVPDGPVA